MDMENRYVTIRDHIDGMPSEADFDLRSSTSTFAVEGGSSCKDVFVKNLYLSVDPYQLNRMKRSSSSQESTKTASGLIPGQVIDAYGVGRVIASNNAEFKEGDLVWGLLGWEEYTVVGGGNMLRKIDPSGDGFPLSYYVSILGTSGYTAYVGLYNVCKPKKGEQVFVSAAAGSVGSVVGQLAKLSGCYVVGCAGSNEKVHMLTEKLGFDAAFNYKDEPDLNSTLKRLFPEGVDIYFDNVGGEMLEAAVTNMNNFGRVALCGVISVYTGAGRRAAPDMLQVVYKRITIQGFLLVDFAHMHDEFISTVSDHLRQGKIKVLEDVSVGLESLPCAFTGLFRGDNVGKKLVQLSET